MDRDAEPGGTGCADGARAVGARRRSTVGACRRPASLAATLDRIVSQAGSPPPPPGPPPGGPPPGGPPPGGPPPGGPPPGGQPPSGPPPPGGPPGWGWSGGPDGPPPAHSGGGGQPPAATNGAALAAVIVGILSLLLAVIGFLVLPLFLAVPGAIVAIVLGVVGRRRAR